MKSKETHHNAPLFLCDRAHLPTNYPTKCIGFGLQPAFSSSLLNHLQENQYLCSAFEPQRRTNSMHFIVKKTLYNVIILKLGILAKFLQYG